MRGCPLPLLWWQLLLGNKWKKFGHMLKRWCSIKEIEVYSFSSMRNFDFKRYTPRPKKLLQASLKGNVYCICMNWHVNFVILWADLCRSGRSFTTVIYIFLWHWKEKRWANNGLRNNQPNRIATFFIPIPEFQICTYLFDFEIIKQAQTKQKNCRKKTAHAGQ